MMQEAATRVTGLLDVFLCSFMMEATFSYEMLVTYTRLHGFTSKKDLKFQKPNVHYHAYSNPWDGLA
jgi:hypothetical protein